MATVFPSVSLFKVAQGHLVSPMTFDVNNVREGQVTLALPLDYVPAGPGLAFVYPVAGADGLRAVTKNNMDDFGFTYAAAQDGWFIMHQPFDPKWEISVDGTRVPFYRTNRSFIGLPLSRGEHAIVLRYWPHTPLRFLLGLSVVVSTGCLFWIFIAALKRE